MFGEFALQNLKYVVQIVKPDKKLDCKKSMGQFWSITFIYLPISFNPSSISTSIIVILSLHCIPIVTPIPSIKIIITFFLVMNIKAVAGKFHFLTSFCKLVGDTAIHDVGVPVM